MGDAIFGRQIKLEMRLDETVGFRVAAQQVQIAIPEDARHPEGKATLVIAQNGIERVLGCGGKRDPAHFVTDRDIPLGVGVGVVEVHQQAVERGWQPGEGMAVAGFQPEHGCRFAVQRNDRLIERDSSEFAVEKLHIDDEIVDRLVENPCLQNRLGREIIFQRGVEVPGPIRLQLRIAEGAAAKVCVILLDHEAWCLLAEIRPLQRFEHAGARHDIVRQVGPQVHTGQPVGVGGAEAHGCDEKRILAQLHAIDDCAFCHQIEPVAAEDCVGALHPKAADDADDVIVEPTLDIGGKHVFLGAIILGIRLELGIQRVQLEIADVGGNEITHLLQVRHRLDGGKGITGAALHIRKAEGAVKAIVDIEDEPLVLFAQPRLAAELQLELAAIGCKGAADIGLETQLAVFRVFSRGDFHQRHGIARRIEEAGFAEADVIGRDLQVGIIEGHA